MYAVRIPRPEGAIQSNSAGNCIRFGSRGSSPNTERVGPHWWKGPRAQELEETPASAMIPGNCGSCPNASSCQAVSGDAPRIARWYPSPYRALRTVASAPVRLVFGSLYVPPMISTRPVRISSRRKPRSSGKAFQYGLR